MSALFARAGAFSRRHARAVVGGAAALALAGLVLALGLSPSAARGTLSDRDGAASKATAEHSRHFGEEPVLILVKGRLTRMLLTADLVQLLGLEGCISGNVPAKAKSPAPVCREFARRKPVQVAYGPGTFINDAAGRILDQVGLDQATVQRAADRAARRAIAAAKAQGLDRQAQEGAAEQARTLATTALLQRVQLQTGLQSVPALNNPRFVLQLVFEPRLGAEEPKPRFAYVFPDKDAALIQARLRSDLSASERRKAIEMLREAVASPAFSLKFGSYVVTGEPVVREGVASGLSHQLAIVLVAAALLVAVALALAFRARLPLLPLALALAVAAVTYGLARLAGASLTLATVALLPVLIALAAAFAALLQARDGDEAAPRLVTAGVVTSAGLAVLLVSPVPMMRPFGTMAAVGIVLAFVSALTAGAAILGGGRLAALGRLGRLGRLAQGRHDRPTARLAAPGPARARGLAGRVLGAGARRPGRTLVIAFAISTAGWALGTRVEVVSDLTRLVPSSRQEVRDASTLRASSGAEGQVSVLVRGGDLADPRAIAWMSDYQGRMLTRHGYSERRRCHTAELCPALAVTNIFTGGLPRTRRQARAALRSLPTYFARNVISPDRRTASIGFVLSEMPPGRRAAVIEDMRAQLDPPAGISAELAGQPVVDDAARSELETSRWTLGLAALLAVLAVLFAVYRKVERAIVPLVPAVLATGWAALAVWILQVPLNPLSAALGAILIAAGSGLGTLLYARYTTARAAGQPRAEALERAWRSSGVELAMPAAVLTAGFLALTASDFKALRDFGAVGLAGLVLELVALLLVLPAALLVAEDGVRLRFPRSRALALARSVGSVPRALARSRAGRGSR